ncbi:MAG: DUF2892 domain-containing protein [Anaeromyxobacter sp.]|nr:DUF2892 domain-containing protein [Anaeromyxobacter sp.]MBL0275698.1 DUF2892 domain-containing protein [Anaeromyxobacter sp.]
MNVENAVRLLAGSAILLSLALGVSESPVFVSGGFLWVTAFVGFNLAQSAVTGFCPAATILKAFGLKPAGHA